MEMIVLLKFEVDEGQLKDKNGDTRDKMHIKLQEYAGKAIRRAIAADGATFIKLIESACAKMMPGDVKKGIGGPPKMTGGEGK